MSETVQSKKTRAAVKEEESSSAFLPSTYHFFHDPADVVLLRSRLLAWYDQEKRELPWSTLALTVSDVNIRMYAVWVSEIMLQQTRVATVIDYYNKWMKRWPTVQDLAAATLEEVNQMWAGLGYYSRGKRLHEGAQKVVSQLEGQVPRSVDALMKQLPGVGRYTAGAVASIALGQVTGAVDGNVIRVLCRLRAIGADCTGAAVTEALWSLANMLVDPDRPGEFNQAVMELGARVCTPKRALCSRCPVQSHCRSYHKVHFKQEKNSIQLMGKLDRKSPSPPDIEDCSTSGTCTLCPSVPWDDDLGVQNFPRKPAKKPPRAERSLTCVVIRRADGGENEFLLTQRPSKGLLAGLWEFPCVPHENKNGNSEEKKVLCAEINRILGTSLTHSLVQYVGEVVHIFSHILQTYVVYTLHLNDSGSRSESMQWLTRTALQDAAVSTGMKKIMKLCDSTLGHQGAPARNPKRPKKDRKEQPSKEPRLSGASSRSRQRSLSSYFQTVKQDC